MIDNIDININDTDVISNLKGLFIKSYRKSLDNQLVNQSNDRVMAIHCIGSSGTGVSTTIRTISSSVNHISVTINGYIVMNYHNDFISCIYSTIRYCNLLFTNRLAVCIIIEDFHIYSDNNIAISALQQLFNLQTTSGSLMIVCISNHLYNLVNGLTFKHTIFFNNSSIDVRKSIASQLIDSTIRENSELDRYINSLSNIPNYSYKVLLSNYISYHKNDFNVQLVDEKLDYQIELSGYSMKFHGFSGLNKVKRRLEEIILWPNRFKEIYKSFNQIADNGILLFGPPGRWIFRNIDIVSLYCLLGTGKSLLPRVICSELQLSLIKVHLIEVVRGEIGSGERALRELFKQAQKTSPSLIFIDEFQAIFSSRHDQSSSTLSSTLIGCLDEIRIYNRHTTNRVFVIAATNEPWAIQSSFLASGRLDTQLLIGTLDKPGRKHFIENILKDFINELSNDEIDNLVDISIGLTGADFNLIQRRFNLSIKTNAVNKFTVLSDLLTNATRSVSNAEIDEYIVWYNSISK